MRVFTAEFEEKIVKKARERGIPESAVREAFKMLNAVTEKLTDDVVKYVEESLKFQPKPVTLVGMTVFPPINPLLGDESVKIRIPRKKVEEVLNDFIDIYTIPDAEEFIVRVLRDLGYEVEILVEEVK